jgi:hypothetical protein
MFVSRPGADVYFSLISLCFDGKCHVTYTLIKFSKSNAAICPSRFHTNSFKVTDGTKTVHD